MLFWDHWVIGQQVREKMRQQVMTWAEKSAVEAQIDFVTFPGDRLQLTVAEEALGAGHDIISLLQWDTQNYADKLEPVDDVVKTIAAKLGPYNEACEHLGKSEGHWAAVPTSYGHAHVSIVRTDQHDEALRRHQCGGNVSGTRTKGTGRRERTYETFLQAAEACHKAGYPFGVGLPAGSVSYSDASNNRALISGKSALIWNPPSAWAVAKFDAPGVAQDCWTFPNPSGPKGRMIPYQIYFWGIWQFSKNKQAARELIAHLMDRKQVEERALVVAGYDIPPLANMTDFDSWSRLEPPLGTLFNYAPRPWHHGTPHIAASSAPQEIAVLVYNHAVMPARISTAASNKEVIAWAKDQLEGFAR